jgi:predicted deacetylase
MNWNNFKKIKNLLDSYHIKPLLAVVPDNRDKNLVVDDYDHKFWNIMQEFAHDGWIIAQHGYQHLLSNKGKGILAFWEYSEFAGLPYEEQYQKIKSGQGILEDKGLKTDVWVAPAHSFDAITCKVLHDLNFKFISDGISLFPFKRFNLIWIPQQLWQFKKQKRGIFTICVHPNSMDDNQLKNVEDFIKENRVHSFYEVLSIWKNSQMNRYSIRWKFINYCYNRFFYLKLKLKRMRKGASFDNAQ